MRIERKVILWSLFILVFCVVNTIGQTTCFRGTITDTAGASIADATVLIINSNRETVERTTSDREGEFVIGCVADGEYFLTISKTGMAPIETKINLKQNSVESTEIVLQARAINETVTVNIDPAFVSSVSEAATKTSVPVRDLPQSVEIVNRQLLDSQAVFTLKDALYNVTAVTAAQGEGRRDQFLIRGFSAIGDQLIDGVRDDAHYYRDLSNIEQIEVVKGPSAALFGRGSSGGIINRTTKKPNLFERIGSAETSIGSFGLRRGSIDFGNPLIEETLAFRVIGAFQRTESFRQYYSQESYSFAPSVSWKPTSRTDLVFQIEFLNDERVPDRGVPSFRGRPLNLDISTYYGFPEFDEIRNRVSSQSVRLEQRLDQTWMIRNVFRRIGTGTDYYNTQPNGVCILAPDGSCTSSFAGDIPVEDERLRVTRTQYNGRTRQVNYFDQVEVLGFVKTLGIQHNLLFGLELGQQTKANLIFRNSVVAPVKFRDPVLARPANSGIATTDNIFKGSTLGFYVQDQIAFNRHWKALLGLRYDNFRQNSDDLQAANLDLERVDKQFSPRAGLVFQPNDWLSIYGSFSRSFQPSGENLSLALNASELKPELTGNFEAGVKASILPLRLNTTISVFRLNRKNIKTSDPLNPGRLILVGEQRTDGIELTVAGSPLRNFDVLAGYSLLDTEITRSNTISGGVLLQGKESQLTPRNSGNLWLTYQGPSGFRLGLGGYARSRIFTSANNLVALPGYVRFDASIGWRSERHFEIAFNLKNITDRRYFETSHGDNNIMPGTPINGSLTLRYRW